MKAERIIQKCVHDVQSFRILNHERHRALNVRSAEFPETLPTEHGYGIQSAEHNRETVMMMDACCLS